MTPTSAGVPVVALTGEGARGLGPPSPKPFLPEVPAFVRLGRIRPPDLEARRAHAVPFARHFSAPRARVAPPVSTNRRALAADSLGRMYLNDQYGDCVIAGKAHALGLWSSVELGPAHTVVASDGEILRQYQSVCGPGDNGCVITNVLDYMRSQGFLAGGTRYQIDGYVSADWTSQLETKVVLLLFGAATVGINLPRAWTENSVWDVTDSPIVGGHDVTPLDYDDSGVYVSSWGRVYQITWAAWLSRTWVEEFYAILAPLWYVNGDLAPCGVDVAGLRADLASIAQGDIPDLPPGPAPGPPPAPTPPPAPSPRALFRLTFSRSLPARQPVAFPLPVAVPAGNYDVVPHTGQQEPPEPPPVASLFPAAASLQVQVDQLFHVLDAQAQGHEFITHALTVFQASVDAYLLSSPVAPDTTLRQVVDAAFDWAIVRARNVPERWGLRVAKALVDAYLDSAAAPPS